MTRLELVDLGFGFDDRFILKDISLSIDYGERWALVGASGSGKSTLLHLIAGLLSPVHGRILLDEIDITGRRGHLSYMPQKDLLLPFKRVWENIALPLTLQGVPKEQARLAAFDALGQFGLIELAMRYPKALSGGQRGRVALLRTALMQKDIWLMDEPFSALDFLTKRDIYAWFDQMHTRLGMGALIVTHDLDEALLLCDKVACLSDGRIAHIFDAKQTSVADLMAYLAK